MSKQKRKGRKGEHKTSAYFNKMFGNEVCRRVPGSGNLPGLPGDNLLDITRLGYRRPFQIQTKNCANPAGWATMEKLLRNGDEIAVIWKSSVRVPMIVMRGDMLQELLQLVMEANDEKD